MTPTALVQESGQPRLLVVTAVYNDWPACAELLRALDRVAGKVGCPLSVLVVDDGSTVDEGLESVRNLELGAIDAVELVELVGNLGNQRALAVGLSEAVRRGGHDAVVVMDADGEDRPEDLPALVSMHRGEPDTVVVAARRQRTEGRLFRVLYEFYKVLFRMLTGQRIAFGNFCLIPSRVLRRLVYTPSVWNNLAASVRRSRFPIRSLDTVRGTRYAGQSSTNLVSLIIHGLSSVSVYSDIAFVRLLIFVLVLVAVTLIGIAVAVGLRLWTDIPTPGWTTTVVGWATVVLLQALLLCGGAVFLLLSQRSSVTMVPALAAEDFIGRRETLVARAGG